MVTFIYPAPKQATHQIVKACLTEWCSAHPLGMRPGIWVFPEAELHPSLRANLADKAVERSERGYDFYVVTHSDEIVLRLQALASKRHLFTIRVYATIEEYVEIPLEEEGRLVQEWPNCTDFWGHRLELISKSIRAQQSNHSVNNDHTHKAAQRPCDYGVRNARPYGLLSPLAHCVQGAISFLFDLYAPHPPSPTRPW